MQSSEHVIIIIFALVMLNLADEKVQSATVTKNQQRKALSKRISEPVINQPFSKPMFDISFAVIFQIEAAEKWDT